MKASRSSDPVSFKSAGTRNNNTDDVRNSRNNDPIFGANAEKISQRGNGVAGRP